MLPEFNCLNSPHERHRLDQNIWGGLNEKIYANSLRRDTQLNTYGLNLTLKDYLNSLKLISLATSISSTKLNLKSDAEKNKEKKIKSTCVRHELLN